MLPKPLPKPRSPPACPPSQLPLHLVYLLFLSPCGSILLSFTPCIMCHTISACGVLFPFISAGQVPGQIGWSSRNPFDHRSHLPSLVELRGHKVSATYLIFSIYCPSPP